MTSMEIHFKSGASYYAMIKDYTLVNSDETCTKRWGTCIKSLVFYWFILSDFKGRCEEIRFLC